MTARRLLVMLVVLEAVAAALLFGWRIRQPAPPALDTSRLDTVSAEELTKLRQEVGIDPEKWRALSEALMGYGYFPESEACYRRALELAPDSFEVRYGYAYCLQRLGKLLESIDAFTAARDRSAPAMQDTCTYHIGRCQLRLDDPQSAETTFRSILRFPPAALHLSRILIRTGRVNEALTLLDELLPSEFPDRVQPLQLKVSTQMFVDPSAVPTAELGRLQRAVESLTVSDHREFLNPIRFQYGLSRRVYDAAAQQAQGRIETAAAEYREIFRLALPSDRRQMAPMLARLELELGRPEAALALLEDLPTYSADTPETLVLHGDALDHLERRDEAVQKWEQAVRLHPRLTQHGRLAEHFEQIGNAPLAEHHTARALTYAGIEAYRANRLESAEAALEESLVLDPEFPLTWFYLAECRRAAGRLEQARTAYQECLKRNPDHDRALSALRSLSPEPQTEPSR